MMDRRTMLAGGMALGLSAGGAAQARLTTPHGAVPGGQPEPAETIDLWPDGVLGRAGPPLAETMQERSADPALPDRAMSGITRPRMVVFRPERPSGAAALIAPGGGYRWVVVDKEGFELARWLNARGVTAFVLFYRLPADGWTEGPNTPLADAQRAIRLVRHQARRFSIDGARVTSIGFSAGGHVCADLAARFAATVRPPIDTIDALSARPDAAAPIYPVVSMDTAIAHAGSRALLLGPAPTRILEQAHSPDQQVPADAPPHFLVHAEDDASVRVENSLRLRSALAARGIAVETHLFAEGGHGFGLRRVAGLPVAVWPELLHAWMQRVGVA